MTKKTEHLGRLVYSRGGGGVERGGGLYGRPCPGRVEPAISNPVALRMRTPKKPTPASGAIPRPVASPAHLPSSILGSCRVFRSFAGSG
jgi:hypothetical protein